MVGVVAKRGWLWSGLAEPEGARFVSEVSTQGWSGVWKPRTRLWLCWKTPEFNARNEWKGQRGMTEPMRSYGATGFDEGQVKHQRRRLSFSDRVRARVFGAG
jgi:hypothetical protein